MDTMGQTHVICAGGNQPLINSMVTQIAFLGDAFVIVKDNGIVGARSHTGLAAGALIIGQNHDAVGSPDNRLIGACVYAGRLSAMSAQIDPENKIEFFIDHHGSVFRDSNELNPVRCPVFLFAGHLAGLTAPAGFVINSDGIGCHDPPP